MVTGVVVGVGHRRWLVVVGVGFVLRVEDREEMKEWVLLVWVMVSFD